MKKLLSVLLVAAMIACMLPVFAVSAADPADVPVAKVGNKTLQGATAHGEKAWNISDTALTTTQNDSMFIFTSDTMKSGKLTVTFDRTADSAKDSHDGIVFGVTGDSMDFWEGGADSPAYYFLYCENNVMQLSKTGGGLGWNVVKRADITDWDGRSSFTITAEWDETGRINGYINGELVMSVVDPFPLGGARYGVRSRYAGVNYTSIKAEHIDSVESRYDTEVEMPIAKWNDTTLKGYHTQGDIWYADGRGYDITDTSAVSNTWKNVFVFTNDAMPVTEKGSLSATFKASSATTENDNGIIFGLEATDNVSVWENPKWTPAHYFMFINDGGALSLAKPAWNNSAWNSLGASPVIEGYTHGTEVTIKAEFEPTEDGKLLIKGYVNGNKVLEVIDENPLTGSRYGIRSEVNNVTYTSIVAEHAAPVVDDPTPTPPPATTPDKPAKTGDMTVLAASVALVALIGTGVVISKKRSFN